MHFVLLVSDSQLSALWNVSSWGSANTYSLTMIAVHYCHSLTAFCSHTHTLTLRLFLSHKHVSKHTQEAIGGAHTHTHTLTHIFTHLFKLFTHKHTFSTQIHIFLPIHTHFFFSFFFWSIIFTSAMLRRYNLRHIYITYITLLCWRPSKYSSSSRSLFIFTAWLI